MTVELPRVAPWPEHWLSPAAAASAKLVPIGSQSYHQVTVEEEDQHSAALLKQRGYRLCLIVGDPQKPALRRRLVYRKQAPVAEEEERDGTCQATAQGGHAATEAAQEG